MIVALKIPRRAPRAAVDRALREVATLWARPPDPGQEKAAIGLAPDAASKTTQTPYCSTRSDVPGSRRSDDRAGGIGEHHRTLADARKGQGEIPHAPNGKLEGR